jgi:hypothetical protein
VNALKVRNRIDGKAKHGIAEPSAKMKEAVESFRVQIAASNEIRHLLSERYNYHIINKRPDCCSTCGYITHPIGTEYGSDDRCMYFRKKKGKGWTIVNPLGICDNFVRRKKAVK